MISRSFFLSLQQAFRSVFLILFPLAFISLFAWATAGATTGSTNDPLRAAIWLWLSAHLANATTVLGENHGVISYLPLGAAIFPIFAIRSGVNRAISRIGNVRMARTYFLLNYLLLFLFLGFISKTANYKISWAFSLLALIAILIIGVFEIEKASFIKQPLALFAIICGIAGIIFTINLAINFQTLRNLFIVIQPGIVGGFLLLILQIIYLPNVFFHTLIYLTGVGISVGGASVISPFKVDVSAIPAIPLLAGLPAKTIPWLLVGNLLIIIFILTNLELLLRANDYAKIRRQKIIRFVVVAIAMFVLICGATYGTLFTKNMSNFGNDPLRVLIFIGSEILIISLLRIGIPIVWQRLQPRR